MLDQRVGECEDRKGRFDGSVGSMQQNLQLGLWHEESLKEVGR